MSDQGGDGKIPLDIFKPVENWCELRVRHESLAVAPRSALHGDDRRSDPYQVSQGIWSRIDSAIDHLNAVRLIVVDAQSIPTYALFTLIRAVIENASAAQWIARPSSRTERIRRRLHLQAADIRESLKAEQLLGRTPRSLDEALAKVRRVADANAIRTEEFDKRPPPWRQMIRETSDAEGSDLGEFFWKLCSGFAHADQWPTLTALERVELPTSDEKIMHLNLTAPTKDLPSIILFASLFVGRAIELFDIRRTPHI